MKKKLLAGLLAFFVFWLILGAAISDIRKQRFTHRSQAAAGAVFLNMAGSWRFVCSGTTIGSTRDGDALFLTARHCVYAEAEEPSFDGPGHPAGLMGEEKVSFSANEAGPFYQAVPFKVSATDDVAILRLVNGAGLPAVRLGTEARLQSGDILTNYTFALNLGRMSLTLKAVSPVFAHLSAEVLAIPTWRYSMPIDGTVAPGSSGSGLFDPRQRALVGVVVGTVQFGGLNIAIPISRVWSLLSDPHPQVLGSLPINPEVKSSEDETSKDAL